MPRRQSFFYRNGLSIALLAMMLAFWSAQYIAGWNDYNSELIDNSKPPISFTVYFQTGHFIAATFENWESEFLQMAIYVMLTVSLRQRGSAESKKLKYEKGAGEEADREPHPSPHAPWPVRKGGLWLTVYKQSLSIAFLLLFALSFCLHFAGSLKEYNEQQLMKGKQVVTALEYITNAHFWFESFQNWQSEFLAVAAIVLLSIWLRQQGSPESKAVDAPHTETGK